MKKILLVILFIVLLTGCNSDPKVIETPNGADIATCTAGQVFKYIYEDDTVYEFYTDDILQNNDMLSITQDSVDSAGSMTAFLETTFGNDTCVFSTYSSYSKSTD